MNEFHPVLLNLDDQQKMLLTLSSVDVLCDPNMNQIRDAIYVIFDCFDDLKEQSKIFKEKGTSLHYEWCNICDAFFNELNFLPVDVLVMLVYIAIVTLKFPLLLQKENGVSPMPNIDEMMTRIEMYRHVDMYRRSNSKYAEQATKLYYRTDQV